jgi:hypothetical protein
MSFLGPKFNKINGGLGTRAASTDGIGALVLGGVATAELALGEVAKLIQLKDAEDLGITASYDANNDILVHYHISEYFRLHPDGTLYIMLVEQGTTMAEMCDKDEDFVKKVILESAQREVKFFGVVLNPELPYVPTIQTGLNKDTLEAAAKAQELIEWLQDEHQVFVDLAVIEGRDAADNTNTWLDLRNLVHRNVNIVTAQDPSIAALDNAYAKHAAVGSYLGMQSIRKVSESTGSVDIVNKPASRRADESYPLTSVASGRFVTAALSNGTPAADLTATQKTNLTLKGHIYAGSYEGYPGIYFNQDATCIAITDDYAFGHRARVWNKAVRIARRYLIPKFNSEVPVDKNTGLIDATLVAGWEAGANKALESMLTANECSDISLSIDANQNVFSGEPLRFKLAITPNGISDKIEGDVGMVNPFNQ